MLKLEINNVVEELYKQSGCNYMYLSEDNGEQSTNEKPIIMYENGGFETLSKEADSYVLQAKSIHWSSSKQKISA